MSPQPVLKCTAVDGEADPNPKAAGAMREAALGPTPAPCPTRGQTHVHLPTPPSVLLVTWFAGLARGTIRGGSLYNSCMLSREKVRSRFQSGSSC